MKTALVTGGAGFIGSHVARELLKLQYYVICLDNFDNFYDKKQKLYNISDFVDNPRFVLFENDIIEDFTYNQLSLYRIDIIVHLAAKAGIRPSIADPVSYQQVNALGTLKILEFAKDKGIKKIIYASSSSVYGANSDVPWKEDSILKPISPYASSKIAGENFCYTYSHLYNIQIVALRFFTVYGPGQRPDLAIHKFVNLMMQGKTIDVYGYGEIKRDFTYIDDIVSGVLSAINYEKSAFEIFNLGNNFAISVNELLTALEDIFEKKIIRNSLPEQPGDVPVTFACIDKAKKLLNYQPQVELKEGIKRFKVWHTQYKINGLSNHLPQISNLAE